MSPKQLKDRELIENIRQGDSSSFDELFNRYWEVLFAAAYARLNNKEEAKDCVQEIFLTLWEKREQLPIPDAVGGYLFTSLKNRILNLFRSQKVKERYIHLQKSKTDEAGENVDELLEYKEFSRMIDNEIHSLPEKMREIFLLSRKQGLSIEEIASQLSLSPQTVKNQISSALKRLRVRLDNYH